MKRTHSKLYIAFILLMILLLVIGILVFISGASPKPAETKELFALLQEMRGLA